jgi:hypothetical protein
MRGLKLLAILGGGLAATSGVQSAAKTSAEQPFSITVAALASEVPTGSRVALRVRLTNTSDHDINASGLHSAGVDWSYGYEVRNVAGQVVHPRPHKQERWTRISGRVRTLKPGESAEDITRLSEDYDLTPGTYMIQLSRHVSNDPSAGVVKSNTVTITIVPERFSIEISAPNPRVRAGSPISLNVRLRNLSDREMGLPWLPSESVDPDYIYLCYNAAGKWFAKDHPSTGSMGDHPATILKPGAIHEQVVAITSACDLSQPGEYRIQLSRVDGDDPARHIVNSNTVTVTVEP